MREKIAGAIAIVFVVVSIPFLIWLIEYEGKIPGSGEDCKQLGYQLAYGPCREAGSPENMQATLDWMAEYDRQKATSVAATATAGAPEYYLENDGIRIFGYQDKSTGAMIYICKDSLNHAVECRVVPQGSE